MSEPGKAVFLSYASQDAEAAKRICDALRAAGVEVWFDQSELVGGDAWDAKIRKQIGSCALFIPIISASTQARAEGYFRLEWKLADRRMDLIGKSKAFLLPVCIDGTKDSEADVPDSFLAVQWTRLKDGEPTPAFVARVKKLLGGETVGRDLRIPPSADKAGFGNPALQKRGFAKWWWTLPIFGVTMALLLVLKEGRQDSPSLPAAVAAPAPLSEARKLVAQARVLFDDGDQSNHENFFLAEDLLKRAQALDPTDGEVWAAQAQLSAWVYFFRFDGSTARREALRMQSERAVKLAPDSIEARLARGAYLAVGDVSAVPEAVTLLEQLAEQVPGNRRILRFLGAALSYAGRIDEAVAAFNRANAIPGGDPESLALMTGQLFYHARYAEVEQAVAQSLAVRPVGRAQLMETQIKLVWRGDLDGAAESLARWPTWLRLEDRGGFIASQVWMWRREPDKAVAALNGLTHDFLNDSFFIGPKAGLLALAHEMAGRAQAARAEWENTRNVASRAFEEDAANKRALAWKGIASARLGDMKAAEAILNELEQLNELRADFWSCGAQGALLRIAVGRGGEVSAKFDSGPRSRGVRTPRSTPQAALRLNPVFDPIRATSEFQQWLAAAPAPEEKKENTPSAAPAAIANEKSIVVLPLENLSSDPDNAFFADGLHIDIIATLQRSTDLKVVSRSVALKYKDGAASATEIGAKLGVGHVLTGSVRRAGDKARIQFELRRTRDDTVVWAQTYDRSLRDALAVQGEVATEIARLLSARELKGAGAGARLTSTKPEAYDVFLKGLRLFYTTRSIGPEMDQMIACFEQATVLDPDFVFAHGFLSAGHVLAYIREVDSTRRAAHARAAHAATEKAMGLNRDFALMTAAYCIAMVDEDPERALPLAETALRLFPNDAAAHTVWGIVLERLGRSSEAVGAYARSNEIEPLNVQLTNQFIQLTRLRRPAELEQALKRAADQGFVLSDFGLETYFYRLRGEVPAWEARRPDVRAIWALRAGRWPELLVAVDEQLAAPSPGDLARVDQWSRRALALRRLGREAEAQEAGKAALQIAGQFAPGAGDLTLWSARAREAAGDRPGAIQLLKRTLAAQSQRSQTGGTPRLQREELARLLARNGDQAECVALLRAMLQEASNLSVPALRFEADWAALRDRPDFQALLADPKNSAPL